MMFKILILQRLFNLSDDQTEFLITDRMSFQRFLGLALGSPVPDAKTIWYFREQLTKNGVIDELFKDFNRLVESQGLIARQGSIIDATFMATSKNSFLEKKSLPSRGRFPMDLFISGNFLEVPYNRLFLVYVQKKRCIAYRGKTPDV